MPQIAKYDINGKQVGEIELADSIFGEDINKNAVHQVVTAQLAKIRKGTASTKTRGEVRGGGRKPWRQKGTGRARAGSIRSPLWVGGGTTFGPKPRSYDKKVSKKLKKLALRSILTDKLQNESMIVLDNLEFEEPKTSKMLELMRSLDIEDAKVVIIIPEKDNNIYLSARNIPGVKTLVVEALNAYDLLNNDYLLIINEAVEKIEEVLAK